MSFTLENSSIHNCKALITGYAVILISICEVFLFRNKIQKELEELHKCKLNIFL